MDKKQILKFGIILNITLAWLLTGILTPKAGNAPKIRANPAQATVIHVPGGVGDLQTAINQVPDGGIIEIAAGTYPSSGNNGFTVNNLQKAFTIRGAPGATVTLDGSGVRPILQSVNSNLSQASSITFERLNFANGTSNSSGKAGGVTLVKARATFIGCTFTNNHGTHSVNSAGGILLAEQSTGFFFNSTWSGNTSRTFGGGLAVEVNSAAYIHHGQFFNNRTNNPGHSTTAAGGGIHVGNSTLRVSNSHFEGNQAGYVGGAIYAIGTWTNPLSTPRSDVLVANTEFVNNEALRHPSVSFPFPTEAGALHAEDQTLARIYNSRFIENKANTGGGVNLYRAEVKIYDSVFKGNRATGIGAATGFGGAISAISNDISDSSTGNGAYNRPSARLEVHDSLIQGRYGGTGTAGQIAGGIFVAGDSNRAYGLGGVSQMGSLSENQAVALVDNVILNDLDVQDGGTATGHGGGLLIDLADLTLRNSLVANSDAIGTANSSGGGLAAIRQSFARVENSTFANNSSQRFGGAVFVQGSTIDINQSNLIENTIHFTHFGSAMFSGPDEGNGWAVNGVVRNSVFSSNNNGVVIFDDDRTNGPINDIHYDNNQFYAGSVNAIIYDHPIWPFNDKTVAELNSLVVTRNNGTSTDKSLSANSALSSEPNVGALLAAPAHILPLDPPAFAPPDSPAQLGYAWSGSSATLDGSPLGSNHTGVSSSTTSGTHTLSVGGANFNIQVINEQAPDATFTISQGGANHTLHWSLTQGTYLDTAIDQGVTMSPGPSGSAQIPSGSGLTYSLYMITKQGGVVKTLDTNVPALDAQDSLYVLAGHNTTPNYGHLPIFNIGGQTVTWSADASPGSLLDLQNDNGTMASNDTIVFEALIDGRSPGLYFGTIDVDGGTAGSKQVDVTVHVVNDLRRLSFYPQRFDNLKLVDSD